MTTKQTIGLITMTIVGIVVVGILASISAKLDTIANQSTYQTQIQSEIRDNSNAFNCYQFNKVGDAQDIHGYYSCLYN